jgi:hypothetical protein
VSATAVIPAQDNEKSAENDFFRAQAAILLSRRKTL